jgi:hypothetical protein
MSAERMVADALQVLGGRVRDWTLAEKRPWKKARADHSTGHHPDAPASRLEMWDGVVDQPIRKEQHISGQSLKEDVKRQAKVRCTRIQESCCCGGKPQLVIECRVEARR